MDGESCVFSAKKQCNFATDSQQDLFELIHCVVCFIHVTGILFQHKHGGPYTRHYVGY